MPEPSKIEGPANPAATARREMAQAKALRRPRRGVRAALIELYGWLDARPRAFRPVLLVVLAACVGLLVAPDLRLRAYPSDPALVGTPVTENIKAPYDLEVQDEETTQRLRLDAQNQVRPVFDFDGGADARLKERVGAAFRLGRERIEAQGGTDYALWAGAPGPGRRPTGKPHVRNLAEALAPGRGEIEEALGVRLGDASFAALVRCQFSPELEAALVQLVGPALVQPVVHNQDALQAFRSTGITLQRVPPHHPVAARYGVGSGANKAQPLTQVVLRDVGALGDTQAVRASVGRQAMQLFAGGAAQGFTPALRRTAQQLASPLTELAQALIEANVSFNRAETESARGQARDSVKPVSVTVKKGEMIIRDGERLTARHLLLLRGMGTQGQSVNVALVAAGGILLLVLLCALSSTLTAFLRRDIANLRARDLLFLASLFLLSLVLCRTWLFLSRGLHELFPTVLREAWLFCLPVAFAAMVVRLVLRAELALIFCVLHSLTLGLLADGDRMLTIYALCGSVAATRAIGTISSRSDLFRAGALAGVSQMVAALGVLLFAASPNVATYLLALPCAMAGGIAASVLALSITPAVEWAYDYTTDLKLLELANLNHPALKELIVQAPGSYHHSIIVGALVEAAAESIGANPLLARVMAYYHDLGKGCNPGYFIENQRSGHNPHDKLKPSMSAMVIRRHVTDGIELAKRHGLGEQILAGIAQHHGNTLIHFFYHKAREQAADGEVVSEADYRYPGTKPQTREAALVMLGDSIEAASRAMAEPNAARLQGLTQRIINSKFTDGQLEECDLTLRDLHTIAKSFSLVLTSIYHHRLEYPAEAQDGKKGSARVDTDSKSKVRTEGGDGEAEKHPKNDLRRLGL